nr:MULTISPECIES: DUF6216 family protein [unclassified Pseudomonas]
MEQATSLISEWNPWLGLAFTVGIMTWAIIRARSAHFLFDRLWRFIGGGATSDGDLVSAWAVVKDMEGFRFRTGINFSSKEAFLKTLKWLESHRMNISDLSFAKAWIGDEPWKVKDPELSTWKYLIYTGIGFFWVVGFLMMSFGAQTEALLSVKKTGTMFWTDGLKATDFALDWSTHDFIVLRSDCQQPGLEIDGVTKEDLEVICSSLNAAVSDEVKSILREQQIMGWVLGTAFFLVVLMIVRYLASARMAKRLSVLAAP